MPRNEVEGVITQSDGYDSNHQAMCKRSLLGFGFSLKNSLLPCISASRFIYLSVVLSVYLESF